MIKHSRSALAAIAVGVTTIAAASLAPTAAGASTLAVTSVSCSSSNNQFLCGRVISGGTSPYSYLWQITSGPASIPNPTAAGGHGVCTAGYQIGIKVTVTDSTGQQAAGSTTFLCGTSP
jgi:hypothetical protein